MISASTLRILDAAANRAQEGLRVVEDFARFAWEDRQLVSLLKALRHDLAASLRNLSEPARHAVRETAHDVGTDVSTTAEAVRCDNWDVCRANCERVKQSLRSLEEFGKTLDPDFAAQVERLRYQFYTVEKALTCRLRAGERLATTRLCVLLDGSFATDTAARLIEAGVGMIQLRDKSLNDRQLLQCAQALREVAASHSSRTTQPPCLFIVNDRPDIARAAGVDGVHLGQDDLPVHVARAILGPQKLVGVSTHTIAQARQAVLDGADYLGVGPTFPSATKQFDAFPGIELIEQVAAEISLPAFAIGGITADNVSQVLAVGFRRVAVSSAVARAADPSSAARALVHQLESA